MDNFTIINLQTFTALIMIYLFFRWWVTPRITNLSIYDVLLPLVFVHSLRYLGMMFMVDNQMIYDDFPKDIGQTIGLWDFSVAILAMITSYTLKIKWKYAIPLVWVFNIYGFVDLMYAFPNTFGLEFYNYDIGGIWFLFVIVGPFMTFTHFYIFYRLFKNLKKQKTTNHG
ncbi:MAG: hypothetical protein ED556_11085 [Winogradskyella sp.]|uniref:hypothetical protein n=1 Tax=Winogradskyella sp. TaxID=1883156 RepID=UPI000F405F59|nr:hypothetical protein [Winogradskyella sp.]RNC85102.1 MAG: hypothetical protein ED556_11085 [Winogradskyella sp.]